MKITGDISEDEMVAVFLKGENRSVRFGGVQKTFAEELHIKSEILLNPNLNSQNENSLRRELLAKYRGFGTDQYLFKEFPKKVRWVRAELTHEEVLNIKYMNYSYWNELSKDTHSPVVAADAIRKGSEIFGISNDHFLEMANALQAGAMFPELILLAENEVSELIVLEGHARLTAYALAPAYIPNSLTVIIGFSPEVRSWNL